MKLLKVTLLWSSCFLMSLPVWASGGMLDTTFNSPDGYVLWDGGSGYDRGRDISVQQDGEILVSGYMTNGTDDDIMAVRYNKNGTPDTGFGTNGAYIYDGGNGNDGAYAIAVQSDNKILLAGDSSNGSDGDVIVLRLDTDGSPDPNFGSNEIFTFDSDSGGDAAIDLLIQSDGKIIVTGQAHNGTDDDVIVLRLTNSPGDSNEPVDSNDIPSLVWSQPPIDIDPDIQQASVFCGFGEPARSTEQAGWKRQWRMDADDFRCLGPIPITRIRWWGGFKAWTSSEPPELQPEIWHIAIWANQVKGITQDESFPERMVWSLEIPPERVYFEPVGSLEFPQKQPDTCFLYEVQLEPEEWFHQVAYESNYDIFWISITAVYPADAEAKNMWAWITRPHLWSDGAVMPAIMGDWPTYDERLFPGRIYPIENSLLCGQNQGYDMCFELLTEPFWINWAQPFMSLGDWPYSEDYQSFATDNEAGSLQVESQVADDWLCERIDPVVAVSWQGSYIGYGYEPSECNEVEQPIRPDYFILSLRTPANVPAGDGKPGELAWEYPAYDYDEVLVGYDRNPEGEPNEPVFTYSVRLPEDEWFRQEYLNQKYWFSVMAVYKTRLDEIQYPWGWTSSSHTFGSTALSATDDDSVPEPVYDQTGEPVDMSFTLFTEPQ